MNDGPDQNYGPYGPYRSTPDNGKIRTRNWFQRNRPFVIVIIILIVLLIGATTTILLLLNRPSTPAIAQKATPTAVQLATTAPTPTPAPQPTPTTQQTLSPTTTSSTPSASTTLSPNSKNYQFICLENCGDKLTATLDNIDLNTSNQTMTWNFTITNNGDVCYGLYGSLGLESPSGDSISQDSGSLGDHLPMSTGQSLPKTATFSTIPQKGTVYTVTFDAYCGNSPTYQPALFSY